MKKTIGIAIPTYKSHIDHLERLLETINNSTVLPDAVSISCSSIEGELKLKEYQFPIILDVTKENRNASQNRNVAGSNLETDIISFIDGDDLPHIKRNEYLLKYFESRDNPVVHNYHKSTTYDLSLTNDNIGDIVIKDKIVDLISEKSYTPISTHISPIVFQNAHISLLKKDFEKFKYDESKSFERMEDSIYNQELIKNNILISYIENKLSVYIK